MRVLIRNHQRYDETSEAIARLVDNKRQNQSLRIIHNSNVMFHVYKLWWFAFINIA